ncbi:Uma2 family endonuclease [soil metagenome]
MQVQLETRYITVAEYEKLGEIGFFDGDGRVELLRGEIIKMSPIGGPHVKLTAKLCKLLAGALAEKAYVLSQSSLRLADSEPQPDMMVIMPTEENNAELPTPRVLFFLAEVCETSYEKDRDIKLPIYAEAGILEVWLVHIAAQRVEVYTQPSQADGMYLQKRTYQMGDQITPGAFTEAQIAVADIFRPLAK